MDVIHANGEEEQLTIVFADKYLYYENMDWTKAN